MHRAISARSLIEHSCVPATRVIARHVPVTPGIRRWDKGVRGEVDERVLRSLWNQHAIWAGLTMKLRARRTCWRTVVLFLTIGGAALHTLAVALENTGLKHCLGAIAVGALLAVAALSGRFLTPGETRKWLRSRSVSEGIKSEIYAYLAGAAPYVGEHALEKLRTKVGSIVDWAKDLVPDIDIGAVAKPLPPPLDATSYLHRRVGRQIDRYRQRAKSSGRRAQWFHWLQILLLLLTALLGAVATLSDPVWFGSWIAVLTTIVGGVTAHAAGSRHELQAATALATVTELQDLVQRWLACGKHAPSTEWSEFVRACEEVISAESRCWMAKITREY